MERLRKLFWFLSFSLGSASMLFVPAYVDINIRLSHIVPGLRIIFPNMAPQNIYTLAWGFWLVLLPFGTLIERSRTRIAHCKEASVLSGFIVGASYPVFSILIVLSDWMDWGAALLITLCAMAVFNPLTAYFITGGFRPE